MGDTKPYWIAFHRVQGIGAARIRRLLQAFGDLETAWGAGRKELLAADLGPTTVEAFLEARKRIDPEREAANVFHSGYQVLTWEDQGYPVRLREISTPPPVLYMWGNLSKEDESSVAMVGTRNPTAYGVAVAQEFGTGFAQAGVTLVSGLARGIDLHGHRSVLASGGRSIAVLGCGLDRIAPGEPRELAARMAQQGAVVSDYPLGTPPEPRNFPPRNRLISGLAQAVVVVEAGEESGALLTAEFAAAQARPVFSVPGPIHSRKSQGTNRLIASGARPALSADMVLHELGPVRPRGVGQSEERQPQEGTERRIWEELRDGPMHADELSRRIGLSASQASACLALLELGGHVRHVGGMQFARIAGQARKAMPE